MNRYGETIPYLTNQASFYSWQLTSWLHMFLIWIWKGIRFILEHFLNWKEFIHFFEICDRRWILSASFSALREFCALRTSQICRLIYDRYWTTISATVNVQFIRTLLCQFCVFFVAFPEWLIRTRPKITRTFAFPMLFTMIVTHFFLKRVFDTYFHHLYITFHVYAFSVRNIHFSNFWITWEMNKQIQSKFLKK